jgi:hypothetical protein
MNAALGLHRVSSEELKRLLRALHRGVLPSPVTRSALIETAFGHIEGHLDALVGRDVESAKALVVAVLGERSAGERGAGAQLVYMGAPAPGTRSRDVLQQAKELLSGATKEAALYGVRPGEDRGLLRTLGSLVEGRGVRARVLVDRSRNGADDALRAEVARHVRDLNKVELFVSKGLSVRMRAVIVDGRRALVTSGELSATEEDGSLDLGVLLDDEAWVKAWEKEWELLVRTQNVVAI